MKTVLIYLVSLMLLAACASARPLLSRQDWLEMTQYTFKDTTVDRVLEASEKVLRLADPTDISIQHFPNKMTAQRRYFLYMVFAASMGSYNFDVAAIQQGNDVLAQLYIGHSVQPIMAVPTQTPGVQGGWSGLGVTAIAGPVNVGTPVEEREAYRLFFMRLDSLLYSAPWVKCDQAKAMFKDMRAGALEALCLLADDDEPEPVVKQESSP